MQEQIKHRLTTLRQEHEAGVTMLEDLENQRAELQQTLLRIGGAMQILQELLDEGAGDEGSEDGAPTEEDPAA